MVSGDAWREPQGPPDHHFAAVRNPNRWSAYVSLARGRSQRIKGWAGEARFLGSGKAQSSSNDREPSPGPEHQPSQGPEIFWRDASQREPRRMATQW